ncbi:MAG: hypothetical protein ACLTGI_03515 [Hoylesella buccalis]
MSTADSAEYHYYLKMKKKAGIAKYLRMYQYTIIKNKALQTMDALVRRYAAVIPSRSMVDAFAGARHAVGTIGRENLCRPFTCKNIDEIGRNLFNNKILVFN